jgi:hypothetical protein
MSAGVTETGYRAGGCASGAVRISYFVSRYERRASAGLLVQRVLPAPAAVLAQLEALLRVRLVLGRHVVAPLADFAGERDRGAFVGGHY